jgi:hypothetical protein
MKASSGMTGSMTNLINHVAFVIDGSGSMLGKENDVVKVFDDQVKWLIENSTSMGQETRVSVYVFNGDRQNNPQIQCLVYDKDVLRTPSLKGQYHPDGGTPLIDATMTAIEELEEIPQKYGDHAFLIYVQTDGGENLSDPRPSVLNAKISTLPDNWTIAVQVPDKNGEFLAKQFGFPANNIDIWDTTSRTSVEDAGAKIKASSGSFFQGRAQGIRGTKSLFRVDVSNLNTKNVKSNLVKVPESDYVIFPVKNDATIRDFIESKKIAFRKGIGHYQLTKTETVQGYKGIYVFDRKTSRLYTGDNARQMLGLPMSNAKVVPGSFSDFDIFIQSTSFTRKLVGGTKLLVMK